MKPNSDEVANPTLPASEPGEGLAKRMPLRPVLESLPPTKSYGDAEMIDRSSAFYQAIRLRRTVRDFDRRQVPNEVIVNAIKAAGTAPSGANLQPWHFVVIQDAKRKRRIREEAEAEEKAFYNGKAPKAWLEALAPLGTDAAKPFLEEAPVLIAIFAQKFGITPSGAQVKHYYVPESVGIATGFLIAALHDVGLVTLTHTPSPMGFLNALCERPSNEKPMILMVVGYPKAGCQVPVHGGNKKPIEEISSWL
jgi:iodotyrosine deiodinase